VDIEDAGRLPDGRTVRRVRLRSGGARLDVLDLGAAVDAWVPAGAVRSVVVGLDGDVAERWRHRRVYAGIVGGRYLSRIRDGRFALDGVEHRLAANDGPHTLHGGPDGFDARTWHVDDAGHDHATLSLVSPDGDQGFPGTLRASVTYRLEPDAVSVELRAETDAPTVVGLGSHPYFDVGDDPVLTVPAQRWIRPDEDSVALPGSEAVDGSPVDARAGRPVPPGAGLDLAYLVDGEGLRRMARLDGSAGTVELDGDQPALQVFTDGALGGVALEAQREPDGPNRPGAAAVLRPGEVYSSRAVWRWSSTPPVAAR
jgi:aldose 1-epimerase